jgi:sucrose-6-phosphate hydrolase SacC (GH32 family)
MHGPRRPIRSMVAVRCRPAAACCTCNMGFPVLSLAAAIVNAISIVTAVADGVRPGYHYTRPSGWMNDPIPFYDVELHRFHLFHICDPNSTKAPWAGGTQAWCHASSADMATEWTTHEVAIPVESPGTGSVVALPARSTDRAQLGGARAAILTASAGPFTPELWVSSDDRLTAWRRVGLVTLPNVTTNVSGLTGTADVHAWRDERRGTWRLITSGGSARGAPPVILSYESSDSVATGWRFTGVLYTGSRSNRLECPSYYTPALSGSGGLRSSQAPVSPAVLTYSWPTAGYSQFWASGTETANGSFAPTQHGQLEYGVGYAGEMTASWPGRLLLFSWMRGVSDGPAVTYVGAQSLPRELRLRDDGTVGVRVATELTALIVAGSRRSANLSVQPGSVAPPPFPQRVPQQARLRVRVRGTGTMLPASFGTTLQNDGEHDAPAAQATGGLRLTFAVKQGSACVFLGSPRQGCAPIGRPRVRSSSKGGPTWVLNATAEVWLDNGLIEIIVGSSDVSRAGSQAVLSAFYPKLFNAAAGLSASVWSENNATVTAELEWSEVASANFTQA